MRVDVRTVDQHAGDRGTIAGDRGIIACVEYDYIFVEMTEWDGAIVAVPRGEAYASVADSPGLIRFNLKNGIIRLSRDIRVDSEHRRRGVATQMLRELREKYPDKRVDPDDFSADGRALFAALGGSDERFWNWLTRSAQLRLADDVVGRSVEPEPPRVSFRVKRGN